MFRFITRVLLAVVVLVVVWSVPQEIAGILRAVRGWGLENLLLCASLGLFIHVLIVESVRASPRVQEFVISAPGRGTTRRLADVQEQHDRDADLDRRAQHEAAHAVAALALRRINVRAHIHDTGDTGGSVYYAHPGRDSEYADRMFAAMVIAVAGSVRDIAAGVHDGGSESDMGQAQRDALFIMSGGVTPAFHGGPITLDALFQSAITAARDILERDSRAVSEIARALVEHRELDSVDLQRYPVSEFTGSSAAI